MLPFCSQIIDLVQDMSGISPSAAATTATEGSAPVAKADPPQSADQQQCQQQCGARFAGILVGSSHHLQKWPCACLQSSASRTLSGPCGAGGLHAFPLGGSSMCPVGQGVT